MNEDIPRHLRPVPDANAVEGALAQQRAEEDWNGVIEPSRRGGSGGFLTDVIVALGFTTRQRVDEAIETARTRAPPPSRCCSRRACSRTSSWRARSPSATASTTSTSPSSRST